MLSGRDVVCISSIEWGFLWQGHQEICSRLAHAGNRVLYIENLGARTPRLADIARVVGRLVQWARAAASDGVREVEPNLFVASPLVLPPFGSLWRRALNRRMFLNRIVGLATKLGMKDPVIWTFLPTDTSLDLVEMLRSPQGSVIYYCMADFEQLTRLPHRMLESEKALVTASDVVFANCRILSDRLSAWGKRVHTFPTGVDLAAFPFDASQGVEKKARPAIGYIGGLHRHIDIDLLVEAALTRPQWDWVFVGPAQIDTSRLRSLPNVTLTGLQPHPRLVEYVRDFDVCLIPYVQSAYTATVVPTKINEYLALGKPVVATELPVILEFNEAHDVVLTTRNVPAEFIATIEKALALPRDAATLSRRREVAALADWNVQLEAMSSIIEASMH